MTTVQPTTTPAAAGRRAVGDASYEAVPPGLPGGSPPDLARENHLRARRLGIDTYLEPVVYMPAGCPVCRSEGWQAQTRVLVTYGARAVVATLNIVTGGVLAHGEAGLSEAAWRALDGSTAADDVVLTDGADLTLSPAPLVASMRHVRAKIHGARLDDAAFRAVVDDVTAGRYSAIELAAFVTACATARLDRTETLALTRAMLAAGEQLSWGPGPIVDKHCVGGLPGNRTTMLIVPLVAAAGLTIPKTSSRAITSPAGTADAMEAVAPVALSLGEMRRVVEREGGCIVWGGAVGLSPADDVIIRVERPLDLDSEGQLVASVLSKKAAAGSTHVVVDVPVGPTAKVRSRAAAHALAETLRAVGESIGLTVRVVQTDGAQPVGRGIGPALEARDVLAVLRGEPDAPTDLAERAVALAGAVLELAGRTPPGAGIALASSLLTTGAAWWKFLAICDAQGGFREPARAAFRHDVVSPLEGIVTAIDNRRLARVAKLAGAPLSPAAGLQLLAPVGAGVAAGAPLYTIHAESPGELAYALDYVRATPGIVRVAPEVGPAGVST